MAKVVMPYHGLSLLGSRKGGFNNIILNEAVNMNNF